MNTILVYLDDELIILDLVGEYASVAEGMGGESVRFAPDSETHLNPFDFANAAH